MKRKNIMNIIIVFGLVISLCTISSVQAAPLEKGDKFEMTVKTQWKFTDRHGSDYAEETTARVSALITGVNSTWVNFTEKMQSTPYIISVGVENGGWTSARVEGERVSTYESQSNRTIDPLYQYVEFKWMDYPTWNNNTAGTQFQGWNDTFYDSRFDYFDMKADDALDHFSFDIYRPSFVRDPAEYTELIETQWKALAYGDVNDLPKLRWNRTLRSWWDFRYDLFTNIAYSAKVLSNNSYGNAEILEFTPRWVGQYWNPDMFSKWNGTGWEPRIDRKTDYADNEDPVTDMWNNTHLIWVLRDDVNYFAYSDLNQRRDSIADTFKNLVETFDENSFSIEFEVEIEDINRITYHDENKWDEVRRNEGTLFYIYECEYHADKGINQKLKESTEYDFGDIGKYTYISAVGPAAAAGVPGFELPVLFFSIVSMGLILRKKRRK